jgi:dolichol-phosphate mannosyltransferase
MIKSEKKQPFISIIIYLSSKVTVYNKILQIETLFKNNYYNFEIILINDLLPKTLIDETKSFLKENISSVTTLINLSFYQGIERAMNYGIELALGDFIVEIDNINLITNVNVLSDLFNFTELGFDLVLLREKKVKLSSMFFYKIFNSFSNSHYSIGSDYVRVISRRAINRIQSLSTTIPYRKAVYANSGLKTKIVFSNISTKTISSLTDNRSETASTALIIFTNFALKFSITVTLLFMLLTLSTSLYTIYIYFQGIPIEGYTTMMLLMSGSFFGIFLLESLIIKYLSVLIQLVFNKNNQIIESIEKI